MDADKIIDDLTTLLIRLFYTSSSPHTLDAAFALTASMAKLWYKSIA